MREHGIGIVRLARKTCHRPTGHVGIHNIGNKNKRSLQYTSKDHRLAPLGILMQPKKKKKKGNVRRPVSTASRFDVCCLLTKQRHALSFTYAQGTSLSQPRGLLTPRLVPPPMLTLNLEWRATIRIENRFNATKESEPAYERLASSPAGLSARGGLEGWRAIQPSCHHHEPMSAFRF